MRDDKISLAKTPIGKIPLGESPLGEIPLGKIPLGATPLGKIPLGEISRGNMPWRDIGRCAFMHLPKLKMVLMMIAGMGGIGLMGCTPIAPDHKTQINANSFDDYCANRAADGVHLPLCRQDQAGRMLALYAFENRCDAIEGGIADCLYLRAEIDRLIQRDLDHAIDQAWPLVIP